MAENKNNINNPDEKAAVKESKTSNVKPKEKKPNIFVRVWGKLVKLCKDTVGELKKVTWTTKTDVWKNFKLVIATVVAVSIIIAIVDLASSWVVSSVAGLIG